MYCKIVVIGRLGKEPEVRTLDSGEKRVFFSLAQRTGKDDETNWYNVTGFGKLAETVAKFLSKGDLALIEGTVTQFVREDPRTGAKRTDWGILASAVRFLEKKKKKEEGVAQTPLPPPSTPPHFELDDYVPF